MFKTLLAESGDMTQTIIMWVILAVLVVAIIVFYFLSSKKRKKQEKDAQDLINAVKPGNKVKTIGGICGILVEVDDEENTFVLETGTERSGKSYVKFDRQAIYQTDAVVEEKPEQVNEEKSEETVETVEPVAPVEEPSAEVTEVAAEPETKTKTEEAKPKTKKH